MILEDPAARAERSLEGLSVGDAFGESNLARIPATIDRVGKRQSRTGQ